VVIGESVLSKMPSRQSRKSGGRGQSFVAKLYQFFLEQDAVAFFIPPPPLAWKNPTANIDSLKLRPSCAATPGVIPATFPDEPGTTRPHRRVGLY
jgi:hypothetical protein